jgi:GTP cyclohydrolase I
MNPALLHAVESGNGLDLERAEDAAQELLIALGEDPQRDGLRDTPRRIAKAYAEFLSPKAFNPTTFPNDEGYDELVLARGIPFNSLCEHHLLPFHGVAHVGYLPGDRIIGLSKLGRVVDLFARRLQVQERLTSEGRRRRDRGRAPVHVPSGRGEAGNAHRDVSAARAHS